MKLRHIIRKTLNFVLSLILFVLITIIIFISSCKNLVTKESISNYVKSIDILNVDLGIIFNLDEKGITLKEEITNLAINSNIPKSIINDILKSEEINIFLGDFFKGTIDYVLKNSTKPEISTSAHEKMNEIAFSSLENHINVMLSEEELEEYIDTYLEKLVNIVPSRDEIIGEYDLDKINFIIYYDMTYLYISLFILCLLFCIINKSFYKLFKYLGITMIISGLLYVMLGCMNNVFNSILIEKYKTLETFISPLINSIATIVFKNGVFVSFIGLFIYITYIISNRIHINNKIGVNLRKKSKL